MDIREKAARRLAGGERTKADLTAYLKQKGFDRAEIDEVVAEYAELGYLDDARYSARYFEYADAKGWSEGRAVMELKKKGVAAEDISEGRQAYLEEHRSDERGKALKVALKMIGEEDLDERGRLVEKVKSRVVRRLASYGYSGTIIFSTISDAERIILEAERTMSEEDETTREAEKIISDARVEE